MSSDSLGNQLHRTPFQPVTLFLPSGKTLTADNLESAMFNETGRTSAVFQGERLILIDTATVEAAETVAD